MIARDSLSEEFYDRTSAQLLAQPEPQYLYARLFLRALNIDLVPPDMIGRIGEELGGQGAPYSTAEQDRLNIADDLATELFAVKADFNGEPGHVLKFNRPKFTDSTYTEEARQIGTNQTISTTPMNAGSEQATLTIKRYAGPYGSSAVQPFGLDAFDSTMGVHDLVKFVGTHLRRDFHKTVDSFLKTLANAASTTVYPYGMSAANDATTAGQFPLTYEQINRTEKAQNEANLPVLPDGRRVMVVTPTGKKQLQDDPQFVRYAAFSAQHNPLDNQPGWFASLSNYHCFMSNTLSLTANSSSVDIHYGHAIAPGAFLGGIGRAPRVAAASDDNYGEAAKVIWLMYGAFGLADNRFVTKVAHTQD